MKINYKVLKIKRHFYRKTSKKVEPLAVPHILLAVCGQSSPPACLARRGPYGPARISTKETK